MTTKNALPSKFRKLPFTERKQLLQLSKSEIEILSNQLDLSELSDILVESSIGTFPVPFGVATGFLIDNQEYHIPMATEEPSVIAAATFAAQLIRGGGGFTTWASEPVMTTQIFIKGSKGDAILQAENKIKTAVDTLIPNMIKRGGGFRGLETEEREGTLSVSIHLAVNDAMGANIANTVSEGIKDLLEELSGGKVLMAILTNASEHRRAKAEFTLPEKLFRKGSYSGKEVCERIVEGNELAKKFPTRAVTHNKGIMNGISALTLATGNDTRAIEAAAHYYAQKEGAYQPLTTYSYESGYLKGSLELPLPLGTIGGTVSFWPASKLSLKLLGDPNAKDLSRIAAALGLAQNLAALFALVTEGIQQGHMRLHAARIAYSVGARGGQIRPLAEKLWEQKTLDPSVARSLLKEMKGS